MRLVVGKDYEESSRIAADMIEEVIRNKRDALLGCATGSSPAGLYQCLTEDYRAGKIDFSEIRTINLDEYSGLARSHNQSFGFYMDQHFFSKVNIKPEHIMLIDGAGEMETEASRYDCFLQEHEIDILVLGIGSNGHIGFNEPSSVFTALTHQVILSEDTVNANSRFFEKRSDVPQSAVTMGMLGIARAKKVVLIATGETKASAIKALFADDSINPMFPCSILKICRDVTVVVDEALYNRI